MCMCACACACVRVHVHAPVRVVVVLVCMPYVLSCMCACACSYVFMSYLLFYLFACARLVFISDYHFSLSEIASATNRYEHDVIANESCIR